MNRYRVVVWTREGGEHVVETHTVEAETEDYARFEAGRKSRSTGEPVALKVTEIDEHDPTPDRAASYVGLSLMAKAILFGGMLSW